MPQIGGYALLRELGRGAMGVVYEARHPDLPRSVALKVLAQADPESLARFEREAQALAGVRHPNVLTIHAVGHVERGPYLVTELLDGEDLWVSLRTRPLSATRAAEVTRDLAHATQAVHDAGVVHRDLKPQNVILRADGSPVLLDFGLARNVGAETLTQSGAIVGTPAFMPPEQALGSSSVLDARSDVYGLGAILFALLARRAPFDGAGLMAVLDAVVTQSPRWPSLDDETVPSALEQICRRAMAKSPSERYPSAAALADDLERFLARDPVDARRAHRGALVALGALALLAPLVALGWPAISPAPGPAIGPSRQPKPPPPPATASSPSPPKPSRPSRERSMPHVPLDRPVATLRHREFDARTTPRDAEEDRDRVHALAVPTPDAPHAWTQRHVLTYGLSVLHLWDLDAPNVPLRSWPMPDGHPMNGFAVAPDGRTVAVGSAAKVRFFDLESSSDSGDPDLLRMEGIPRTLAFSPNGDWLVLGREHDGALAYRWPSRADPVNLGSDRGWALSFSADGRWLAAGSGKIPTQGGPQFGFLHVWDSARLAGAGSKLMVNSFPSPITILAFTPDSKGVVAGDFYGAAVRIDDVTEAHDETQAWNLPPPPNAQPIDSGFAFSRGRIYGLAFAADGETLYYMVNMHGNAVLRVLHYPSGEEIRQVNLTSSSRSLALTPDGERLLLGSDNGVVDVYAAR